MNFDEEIQKYREKIALLQQKKKELATKQYAKITALLFDTIQKDENFYSDFIKLLEKYKADGILLVLSAILNLSYWKLTSIARPNPFCGEPR